eukprot:312493_1
MRWSNATIQIALQLMCNGANTKIFDRINGMNIIKLPSQKIMKLKRYELQHRQGVSLHFLKQMRGSLLDWREANNNVGEPFLILKYDEMYVRGGIVFNPNSMEILGLTSEFESANLISPLYQIINDISNNKNVDQLIMKHNSAKVILQTIITDLGSSWEYVGPYWSSSGPMDIAQMYEFLINELLMGMSGLLMEVFALISDMSAANLSFIHMLSGKTSDDLIGSAILLDIPFYSRPTVFLFDAQHSLKSLRNALFDSRHNTRHAQHHTYPLQSGSDPITVDHLREMYKRDTTTYLSNRTLSDACLYLNPWSKQRVPLALKVFNAVVSSKMDGVDEYKGTKEYIDNTMKLLIGTFVAPLKGTGVFDNITTPQNGMIDRIAEAFQYFEQLQTNVHSKLHIKRYLMISSIRYGFEYVCQQFCNHYQDPNSNGKILDGVFLRPSRLSTNNVEKHFSKIRGMGCDGITQLAKGNAIIRTQQSLALKTKQANNSSSRKRARSSSRSYKDVSAHNKRKRRKQNQ